MTVVLCPELEEHRPQIDIWGEPTAGKEGEEGEIDKLEVFFCYIDATAYD